MADQSMEKVLNTALEKLREMVDVDTIVGRAIETKEGITIIPISKVSFGYGIGGFGKDTQDSSKPVGETSNSNSNSFSGGSGGGVSISPVGFIVVNDGVVKMMNFEPADDVVSKLIENVPTLVNTAKKMFAKKEEEQ